jgi:hypothetical protein
MQCARCDKAFPVQAHRLQGKWPRRFCSWGCFQASLSSHVTLSCKHCGKEFTTLACYTRRKVPAQFCSRACFYKGRRNPGFTGGKHADEARAVMSRKHKQNWENGTRTPSTWRPDAAIRSKMSAAQCRRRGRTAPLKGEELRTNYRNWRRAWGKKHRQTLIGAITNRLRSVLRARLRKMGAAHRNGAFKLLSYGPVELERHIRDRLEFHQRRCGMCGKNLHAGFDIDHVHPLSTAKTVEEIIALFALDNLDVLCPRCNRHVKRARIKEAA